MKKFLFVFIFLISSMAFSWETINTVDEFDEPTGYVRVIQNNTKNFTSLFVDVYENNFFLGIIDVNNELGNLDDTIRVSVKIDKNDPVEFLGQVCLNSNMLFIPFPKKSDRIIQDMKKGNTIKIVLRTSKKNILYSFSLVGFSETYKKVDK